MGYDETLHVLKFEIEPSEAPAFGVVVTPFFHSPGAFPMVKVGGEGNLTDFLERDLGLAGETVREILNELPQERSGTKYHLYLPDEQLSQLGLRSG